MATKKRKYYSNAASKAKKSMSISAETNAELARVKAKALEVNLGSLNLSIWFEEKLQELINEIDADIAEKKKELDKKYNGDVSNEIGE